MIRKLNKFTHVLRAATRMTSSSQDRVKNILTDKYGGVMTIAINRPDKRNAVNPETARELVHAFTEFEQDTDALVAVLHGKGGNFCSGYDLSALATYDQSVLQEKCSEGQAPLGISRMCFSKPVIACIDGYAVAGGLELALMCDLRVVEESAVLGVFCRRFGVPLIDGGSVRLQKLIGLSRAMDLILTGRAVSGKEALDIGLANRITATGGGLADALQLAHSLLKFPQQCMNTDRRSVYNAAYNATSQDEALAYEYDQGIKVITAETVAGAQTFMKGTGKHGSFNLKSKAKV